MLKAGSWKLETGKHFGPHKSDPPIRLWAGVLRTPCSLHALLFHRTHLVIEHAGPILARCMAAHGNTTHGFPPGFFRKGLKRYHRNPPHVETLYTLFHIPFATLNQALDLLKPSGRKFASAGYGRVFVEPRVHYTLCSLAPHTHIWPNFVPLHGCAWRHMRTYDQTS